MVTVRVCLKLKTRWKSVGLQIKSGRILDILWAFLIAMQGKFEPERQTKNHSVDELAPLSHYLFIYLLIPCDPRGKQIKIPASI